jgi:hypothetical protein
VPVSNGGNSVNVRASSCKQWPSQTYIRMIKHSSTRCVYRTYISSPTLHCNMYSQPTGKRAQDVLADFQNIRSDGTYGEIVDFLNNDFRGEGQELEALTLPNFNQNPEFLNNVTSSSVLKAFAQTVNTFWTSLIRGTNDSIICPYGEQGSCESSLIPLNHTFVVPGTRRPISERIHFLIFPMKVVVSENSTIGTVSGL